RREKRAYKISQFDSIVSVFRTSNDIVFSVVHESGVEAQVAWCGDTGRSTDVEAIEHKASLPSRVLFFMQSRQVRFLRIQP
ncbi:MAG: hypothetical protein K6G51_05990, partial [Sphaerochaetaceae bacterium]|nr:hypothetical protein [Sphaerochaetaceae bacterium]